MMKMRLRKVSLATALVAESRTVRDFDPYLIQRFGAMDEGRSRGREEETEIWKILF